MIRDAIHQSMTLLVFASYVEKLGGNMWPQGADKFVFWVFYNEKLAWQHFSLHVTTIET